jgi:hypothetical protein
MEAATGDVINAQTMSDQQNITAIDASTYIVTRDLQASRTDKGTADATQFLIVMEIPG